MDKDLFRSIKYIKTFKNKLISFYYDMREYLQDAYMEFEEEFLLKIIEKKADPKEPTKEEWI
jgi:hypothetical protein